MASRRVEVSVEIGNSQQVLEALDDYRVDVAASSQLLEDPRLIRRVLGSDPLVLAVHRNHPLAVLEHVPLTALAGHTLLMREPGSTTRRLTEEMLQGAGVSYGPLLEIGSRESIREAVLRNIGISIIARQEVPHDPQLRVYGSIDIKATADGISNVLTWRFLKGSATPCE